MSEYFGARRRHVDEFLRRYASGIVAAPPLVEPLRVALTSGGKRFRALLLIATGEAFGARTEHLLPAAAAFEMIHTSSLILDDLPAMDDAKLRRGEPTLHLRFGEDRAILAAVALLNHAYELIADSHEASRPRRWREVAALRSVIHAVGWDGTIGGESVDLHSEGKPLDFQTLEYIHSRKTGALFVAAAAVGAMLGNAPEGAIRALEAYAKNLGLAFQITDDVLDVVGTPETLGKDVGKDAAHLTFVKLAGIDGARQLTAELIDTSLAAIAPLGKAGVHLAELAVMVRDRTS